MRDTGVWAHRVIAEICVARANEIYEENAIRGNNWYKMHPDRQAYVDIVAPTLIAETRAILGHMLTLDSVTETEKREIHEALCFDAALPGSHNRGVFTPADLLATTMLTPQTKK